MGIHNTRKKGQMRRSGGGLELEGLITSDIAPGNMERSGGRLLGDTYSV